MIIQPTQLKIYEVLAVKICLTKTKQLEVKYKNSHENICNWRPNCLVCLTSNPLYRESAMKVTVSIITFSKGDAYELCIFPKFLDG